jgi:hypothetical protein
MIFIFQKRGIKIDPRTKEVISLTNWSKHMNGREPLIQQVDSYLRIILHYYSSKAYMQSQISINYFLNFDGFLHKLNHVNNFFSSYLWIIIDFFIFIYFFSLDLYFKSCTSWYFQFSWIRLMFQKIWQQCLTSKLIFCCIFVLI